MPKSLPGSRIVERVRHNRVLQAWPPPELRHVQSSWRGPLHVQVEGVDLHLRYVGLHRHQRQGEYPLHRHPYAELLIPLEGRGQLVHPDGSTEEIAPGGIQVLQPERVHGTRWRVGRREWPLLVVDFDLAMDVRGIPTVAGEASDPALAPFFEWFYIRRRTSLRLRPAEWIQARTLALEMRAILATGPYGASTELLARVLRMIALISRSLRERELADGGNLLPPSASAHAALLNARIQMESRVVFAPGLIRSLARASGLSDAHFIRAFRAAFGLTPKHYAQGLLMRRACGLLHGTDLPVRQIAAELHYEDPAIFSRAFRRFVGVSPSEFRDAS